MQKERKTVKQSKIIKLYPERLLIPVCPSPPTPDTEHLVMDKNELIQKAKLAEQAVLFEYKFRKYKAFYIIFRDTQKM